MTIEAKPFIYPMGSLDVRENSVSLQLSLADVQSGNYEIIREQFGPGRSGQRSYDTVLSTRKIISRIDNGLPVSDRELIAAEQDRCSFVIANDVRCNAAPTGTVNFDVIGEEDFELVCSRDHGDQVARRLEDETEKNGRSTVTARNGWGRA